MPGSDKNEKVKVRNTASLDPKFSIGPCSYAVGGEPLPPKKRRRKRKRPAGTPKG